MKKLHITIIALIAAASLLLALPSTLSCGNTLKTRQNYVIGFYNLENLFDTYHEEGKNDYEFLPDGANEWT